MDISVEGVDGLPAHTYISVRYGEVRKQAPFRNGEVLRFPRAAGKDEKPPKAYTVDIVRKVGSKQVSLAGITALGGTVRSEHLEIPSLEIQGSPVTASLCAKMAEAPPKEAEAESGMKRTQRAALKAKSYLEKHGVQLILHEMFAQLVEQQPGDPLAFMIEHLETKQEVRAHEFEEPNFASQPGLGPDMFPGFADGNSPEDLPNLDKHHSIMADIIRKDPSIYERLRGLKTSLGVSVAQCIKPGIDCLGHDFVKVAGAFAGDEESYSLFCELFDPVVSALHSGWAPEAVHPRDADPAKLADTRIDPTGRYAVYASMEVRRNFRGLRLPTCCSQEERRQVERIMVAALESSTMVGGTYLPLRHSQSHAARPGGMTALQEERLRCKGMLFTEPDSRMRLSAGLGRDWPDARGVVMGGSQGVHVWCNEEDHLRFFARQHMVNLKQLWTMLSENIDVLGEGAERAGHGYSSTEHLGYTTACPSRLGTAMRISVCLRISLLAATTDLEALCQSLGMQSSQEMENPGFGSVWNITSPDSLGISEVGLIQTMIRGCTTLVSLESRLENGEPIYDAMPGLGEKATPGFPTEKCPDTMPDLSGCSSFAAAVLGGDPGMYDRLKQQQTPLGVCLAPCLKPAIDVKSSPQTDSAGLVAGDEACFETFRELFDPVLVRLHSSFTVSSTHPTDWSVAPLEAAAVPHCSSVRVELRRNLGGLRLAPCCTRAERQGVERLVGKAMMNISNKVEAEYFPLAGSESYAPRPGGTDEAKQAELYSEGLLFLQPTSPAQLAAGVGRCWPEARGAFVAKSGDMAIWCNEEDHLRVLAWSRGADLSTTFSKAYECVEALGKSLAADSHGYMCSERLGFLTVDPAYLGGGLVASAAMRLPRLGLRPDFVRLCENLRLQASWRSDAWEVTTRPGLGVSAGALLGELHAGCAKLSALEGQLELGRAIEGELPTAQ